MKFAVGLPNVREYGDPALLVELGHEAELAGWDGVFVWDHLAYREPEAPVAVPWIAVAGLADRTQRIALGVMVCALARRRPWKVAREAASLDVLSGGRLRFGAGLGSLAEEEFAAFGEDADPRVRAARLDEALEIVAYTRSQRPGDEPLDVVIEGQTDGPDAARIDSYADVGLTWWIEKLGWFRGSPEEMRARIAAGPPA